MNRRSFLYGGAVLGAVRPGPAAPAKDSLLEKVAEAALSMQRHSWEQGILAQAFLDMGDRERVILMTKSAMVEKAPDGRLAAIGGGATDPAMGGAAYWRAAEWTGDPQMQQAARGLLEFVLKKAPRAADGTCYHVFNAPEMWSDSFYTTPPFLAATGHYDDAIFRSTGCGSVSGIPPRSCFRTSGKMAAASSGTRCSGESGTVGRRRDSRA